MDQMDETSKEVIAKGKSHYEKDEYSPYFPTDITLYYLENSYYPTDSAQDV